ncbi:MAG: tetratricopeptide repeat protein [Parachlamydia sp.]|nr:tetratricopeptide repeat protein [Parachlamydia sp.]
MQPLLKPPAPNFQVPPGADVTSKPNASSEVLGIPTPLSATAAPLLKDDNSAPSPAFITSKEKGDFHLERKEIPQAIEWYGKSLQKAEEGRNKTSIRECLTCIGRAYLEKGDWVTAAKFFNSAFALCNAQDEKAQQVILGFMAELDVRFLDKVCGIKGAKINKEKYHERRRHLFVSREAMRKKMAENHPSKTILKEFSQETNVLLEGIFQEGASFLGKPPCEFAVLGLGSGGRQEMSPYSDLEFAILVKDNSPKNLAYFRKLVAWVEIQVIHLGETEFPLLDHKRVSPTPAGYQFDKGGNTPLAKHIELLNIPKALADLQSNRFYDDDFILTNTLRGAGLLFGPCDLYDEYMKSMQPILKQISKKPLTIAQTRAWETLKGHLIEFAPQINEKKQESPNFDIKAELYRLPNFLIAGLADYYGIEKPNTWDKIDALVERKILSKEGGEDLKKALSAVMALRIRCHLYYRQECDKAYHPSMQHSRIPEQQREDPFLLSDADIASIIEIYRVIFPLNRLFQKVCLKGNFADLVKERFFDSSMTVQGGANNLLGRYDEANQCLQQALALNPEDPDALLELAGQKMKLAKHSEAKAYAEKVMAVGKQKQDEDTVRRALNMLGTICHDLGETRAAAEHFEQALAIAKRQYGDESQQVVIYLGNLTESWRAAGNMKKAIAFGEEALEMAKKQFSANSTQIATIFNNLGLAWQASGNGKKALDCYKKALKIDEKIYRSVHPDVGRDRNNIGFVYQYMKEWKKAISHHEKALQIFKKVYGEEYPHPHVATTLTNIGTATDKLGDLKKAADYHTEALRIFIIIYGENHPNVAICLHNLAAVSKASGDPKMAIEQEEKAVEILKRVSGEEHPNVALFIWSLGTFYKSIRQTEKALASWNEALRILKKNNYDDSHPDVKGIMKDIADNVHLGGGNALVGGRNALVGGVS